MKTFLTENQFKKIKSDFEILIKIGIWFTKNKGLKVIIL